MPPGARLPDAPLEGARPPLGISGARALSRAIRLDGVDPEGRDKYGKEFARYRAFCEREELDWRPMDNDVVLAYLDQRCAGVKNSASAEQWRTQLWRGAEMAHGTRKYDPAADGPFWKESYVALAARHGCDRETPPALSDGPLRKIYESEKPDYDRDPIGYVDWVHLLLSQAMLLRPNEHTGPTQSCYARNFAFPVTSQGTQLVELTHEKGCTKGERRAGIRGYSGGAVGQAQRSATHAASGRVTSLAREKPGSPLCLLSALRPMWQRRQLGKHPERPLFPHIFKGGFSQAPMDGAQWNRRLKAMLARAGLTEVKYTSRGARSGGRTALATQGVPRSTRDQLGRWGVRKGESRAGALYDRIEHDAADLLPAK
jgi:hypothetical protein